MTVPTSICTLYEGHYHYGVGALVNSLYHYGFRGTVRVGFRGDPPPWARPLRDKEGFHVFSVAEGIQLHLIPLDTTYHLTNYKPTFLLELWDRFPEIDGLCYLDPDIVIKRNWTFFDDWITDRVGLCEDVNSPLNANAPERIAWQRVMKKHGVDLPSPTDHYVNGGFVGLRKKHRAFVQTWKELLDLIAGETESLDISFLADVRGEQSTRLPSDLFYATEQDALNCATMLHYNKVAIANRSAMDFGGFGSIMSHAIGGHKPWRMDYVAAALDGRRAGPAQKLYWQHVRQPIRLYGDGKLRRMRWQMKLASFISNFYTR